LQKVKGCNIQQAETKHSCVVSSQDGYFVTDEKTSRILVAVLVQEIIQAKTVKKPFPLL
jgi:hypothetical protein